MVRTFELAEARTRFSELIRRALSGEEIVITSNGAPVLKLVPVAAQPRERRPGSAKGKIHMAPDFDAPLEDFAKYV
jgi:prevent-host-death family protein